MTNTALSNDDWHVIGFDEGAEAGRANMIFQKAEFGPSEELLSVGHNLLDGIYSIIRRRQADFTSMEAIQSWIGGVVAGAASVGARIGYQTSIEYPYSRHDGGVVTYFYVTRDFGPFDINPRKN